jgi:type IV secretory pathway VirB2 component (pilin)
MMLSMPMPNASLDFLQKIQPTLLGQMTKIAIQIGDGVLIVGLATPLKDRDGFDRPCDIVGLISHLFPRLQHSSPAI